jgi:TonB family protein
MRSRSHLVALLLLITLASFARGQAVPQRIRVSPGVMQNLLVKKVQPQYPSDAKHIQGAVVLKAVIDKEGNISNLQLISGHPMLAPAAIEAVKQWTYKPFLLNGEPIEVETNVTVNFTLADKPPAEGIAGDKPGGVPPGEIGSIASPADATNPSIPQRVRVSSGVSQGLLVSKVPPQYPPDAKDQRIQGVVLMKVTIDKEGNVANIQLVSGHPMLAPPAIEAVKQWKYKPYLLNSAPVEVETQVQVNFTLAN